MDVRNLPGSVKVAILVQQLGKNERDQLLSKFSGAERETIQRHIAQLGQVPIELAELIAEEFTSRGQRVKPGPEKRALSGAPEKKKDSGANGTFESSELKTLQSLDADTLADLIGNEHPQTVAMILVHLRTEVAGEVLSKLPDDVKTDVAVRIANLDRVKLEMVGMLDKMFEDVLKHKKTSALHETGGIRCLADILNQMTEGTGEVILNEIEESDPELAAKIKERMFVFEDLVLVDDQGLQKVLRGVETKELATALKAASSSVKEKIFRNMSERAAEILKEEIESLGPVRMKDVEDAQQMISKIVQAKEAKGELIISGRKGEDLIA
ncbi:MAG TPA: flagellar motor switch protein FliG [Thermodesulfobacteriota bacterium]|nr:flagellar motor switch protein FliG [Deltaproteobacteria bacterium]HNU70136.1 flagellar motor switch protein FliG [Thermodesulfobacteriota bacterium]HOC39226.1 flagellar motor switch protein FliG [Thermodesulfobacteriota bacterium]HQO77194.1 flagellar motor switch protein FliG [Thermodesulfobacteriota bacterium]